jgi:fructokinase
MEQQKLYGAIEFGGTKTICSTGFSSGEITAQTILPTRSVEQTLSDIYAFFDEDKNIAALGVGAFGPLHVDASSKEYGSIYNTPKAGWENVRLKSLLEEHFKVPIVMDLDVNCAAIGELYHGVAQGVCSFVYLTLGTGIGGSLIIDKQIIHGLTNIEMGHIRIPHEPFSDSFQGVCPYHGDCLEGIASGFAMEQRYALKAEHIVDGTVWDNQATYISAAIHNIMMSIGPRMIVLGGGLIKHSGFIEKIRTEVSKSINGYLVFPNLDSFIVRSSSDTNGVVGAIKLAVLNA